MAQDRGALESWAHEFRSFTFHPFALSMTIESLPDEERFESLAARLRPFTLSELSYVTVNKKISTQFRKRSATSERQREALGELRGRWESNNGDEFGIFTPGDGDCPRIASAAEMAHGWMYWDLVHACVSEEARHVTAHSLQNRFLAAVPYWSEAALVVLETLDMLRALRESWPELMASAAWQPEEVTQPGSFDLIDVRPGSTDGNSAVLFARSEEHATPNQSVKDVWLGRVNQDRTWPCEVVLQDGETLLGEYRSLSRTGKSDLLLVRGVVFVPIDRSKQSADMFRAKRVPDEPKAAADYVMTRMLASPTATVRSLKESLSLRLLSPRVQAAARRGSEVAGAARGSTCAHRLTPTVQRSRMVQGEDAGLVSCSEPEVPRDPR